MSIRDGLETVTDLVDCIEGGPVVVEDVSISVNDDGGVNANLSVWLPDERSDLAVTGRSATDGADQAGARSGAPAAPDEPAGAATAAALPSGFGTRAAAVGADLGEALQPSAGAADRTEPAEDHDDPRGTSVDEPVPCRVVDCEETFETDHGMKIHATKVHDDAGGNSPHRDPERLREVYETHETFEEMTEALGVDVTAQTVRRSMMSLGVHEPGAGADGSADAAGEPTADGGTPDGEAADGEQVDSERTTGEERADTGALDGEAARERARAVDELLPAVVDGETFVEAVRTADTLYEVQRELEMAREEVQSLLAELDLLELVHGRVATRSERDVQRAEIERRIVERAGPGGERPPVE